MYHFQPKTLKAIAEFLGARLQGDANCLIYGIASLKNAGKGEISFLGNAHYRKYLPSTKASAVIVSKEDAGLCPVNALITDNPHLSLVKLASLFDKSNPLKTGLHHTVIVGDECEIPTSVSIGAYTVLGDRVKLGEGVVIGAGCVIGNDCQIGAHSMLRARVTFYDKVSVGEKGLIHSGAVIGSDGFGFANEGGAWIKMPHLGGVRIGDRVEIGANTAIDRGAIEDTCIGHGVIIDNLVQIGHNVHIGANSAIAGCAAIAGSTSIGEYCLIGGGARIAGHIQLADHVHITGNSAVNHSLSKGVYSSGFPAKPAELWRKNVARFNFLDEMAKRLRALEQRVSNRIEKMRTEEE